MHALWDYPAAACIFLFFTFPISFGPAAGRQAGFPLLADRVGVCVRKPEAAGFEKNDRCTGYLIVLLAYEVQYLICLEFRGRFTLFGGKLRISVNEIH